MSGRITADQQWRLILGTTITEVVDAFWYFFDSLHRREFRKTLPLTNMRERDLLPLVRTYLLGYFDDISPEARSKLPGSLSGNGSIDFMIGNVAVEFAVRRPTDNKRQLSHVTNSTEIKKLLKHDGLAVLVLYDFSKSPYDDEDLERYRDWPSLGQGNHNASAFNVAYFFNGPGRPRETLCIRKNIRV